MKKIGTKTQGGFSMIELLVVLVILGVVVTFAVLALGSSIQNIDRQTIAKEFKVALDRARFDSVKRRPETCAEMSYVEITSDSSFRYVTDLDQNGTLTPATETRVVDFGSRSQVRIVDDPAPVFPIKIRFDRRGNTSSGECGSEVAANTPTVFCQSPCGTPDSSNASGVYVSLTGTVSLLRGGEDVPEFDEPPVTDVAADAGINEHLAVWTGTPPTPTPYGTPSDTVTPTPDPTGTPDPTPDPDPSGTPTPTPTATPALPACEKNAYPGTPPTCDCAPPRFKQGNGMCK